MQVLSGKRFFIVLDDIWSERYDDWRLLQTPFRYGAKGSRIVITTRIEKIANMMITKYSPIITLERLSNDDCWRLFQQHANEDTELTEMQDLIVSKCNGLPLAAKTLGGLLKSTLEKRQRQKILESNVWGEESSILPVLRLSYLHLPSNLKRVFAYCSVLPKDYDFTEREVVLLWMAQGFLPENQSESMENIGHDYFLDLVSRSLLERSPKCKVRFIMHDLIHDLAQLAAGDVCCVMDTMDIPNELERTRHVFFTRNVTTPRNRLKAPQLRTFHSGNGFNTECLDIVEKFHYIRTLIVASEYIEVLPKRIGDLKHLRFLSLKSRRIKVLLPQSISNLWNLQTLCLKGCINLEKIPSIRFLGKLRHLYICDTSLKEMPLGIGKLTNLQTLEKFVLAAGRGSRLRDLENLNHLHGRLVISGLENLTEVEDARKARLHEKKGLDKLYLEWNTCREEVDESTKRDVVEQLQPYTTIKECELKGYMGLTLPGWLGDPSFNNMVDIWLEKCEKCECLPPLGQLPLLKSLWVISMNYIKEVGPEFYGQCSTPFPALRTLYFREMNLWEKWVHSPPIDNNSAFPCLEELSVDDCLSLRGNLPPLRPCLKTLVIRECKGLSVTLPVLPLLEELRVDGCKVLSTTADVIYCSKRMILINICEMIGLPGRFPYLCEELHIDNCLSPPFKIDQIPVALRRLRIFNCRKVQSLKFQDSSSSTSCLEELVVVKCQSIVSIGHIPLTLQSLEIDECEKLQLVEFNELPCSLAYVSPGSVEKTLKTEESEAAAAGTVGLSPKTSLELPHLTELRILKCPSLVSLHEGLLFPALKKFELLQCENMERLPSQLHNFTSLQKLVISGCPKVNCFPEGDSRRNLSSQPAGYLSLPSSLTYLSLEAVQNLKIISCSCTQPNLLHLGVNDCPNLESLVGNFTSVKDLLLLNCLQFRYFPEGGLPRNLESLSICGTNIDKPIQEWGLHLLTSLHFLQLEDVGSSKDSVECISDLHLPPSLSELEITGFHILKTICCSALPNLTKIWMKSCPKFESFGENGLPQQIEYVGIKDCDLMKQNLVSDPYGRVMEDTRYAKRMPLSGSQPRSVYITVFGISLLIGVRI